MTPAHTKRSFATAAAFVIAMLTAPLAALAATDLSSPAFTMTVFDDTSSGRKVVVGQYSAAIEDVNSSGRSADNNFELLTSLCVAYAKSGDLEKASSSCDAAIARVVKRKRAIIRNAQSRGLGAQIYSRYLAVALANRGVLYAAAGQRQLAREKFEQALEMKTELTAPEINLARLDMS